MKQSRSLALAKEALSDLTTAESEAVVAANVSGPPCNLTNPVCVPTCGPTCTGTSTARAAG